MVSFESLKSSDFAANIAAMKLSLCKTANGAIGSKKMELFSFLGFDTKPTIVTVVVHGRLRLPLCRGSPGTHLVTTLGRNVPKFYMHLK